MHRDVRLMVLLNECANWLAIHHAHIFIDTVHLDSFFWFFQYFIDVLNADRLVHPLVRLVHIMQLRCGLRHLQNGLCLRDTLGGAEYIGVGHRHDVNAVIKVGCIDRFGCSSA